MVQYFVPNLVLLNTRSGSHLADMIGYIYFSLALPVAHDDETMDSKEIIVSIGKIRGKKFWKRAKH